MPSTLAADLENDRPRGMPWSEMPAWFHAATFVYFATNVFTAWAFLRLDAPVLPTVLGLFGLLGGFIEHTSPYFPKVYVAPLVEKLLFRVPTILAYLWVGLWLGLAWYVVAVFVVHAVVFFRQDALTSMDPRFHLKHILATHVSGAIGMYVLIVLQSGQFRALDILVGR
jgi:hypothetical protein